MSKNLEKFFATFILLPLCLFLIPSLIFWLPKSYQQISCDLIALILIVILNKTWLHVKVDVFSGKRLFYQLLNAIPAIVLLLLTKNPFVLSIKGPILMGLMTIIMIAICEEYIYRGILIPLSLRLTNNKLFIAVLISSVGFAFAHIVNFEHGSFLVILSQIILAFATGMLFGTLYLKSNNLSLVIVLHLISDLPLLASKGASAALTNSQTYAILMIVVVISLIACLISLIQLHGFIFNKKVAQ
ncbi:CPBP family intramembrane glutamic endopeptidase [Companilactobacillus huachuanensis]|uniref:CPBP family intramembrane glutamic endopeptidase n=1 Tax=Companilactobacillus huachuanensis TaxID=2559914 RepID=A0ABW1RNZ8_9LACO|nr:CPBP family intramembrane glutamic endopeptidase [Companilactobacillus huachuanensis]